MKLEILEKLEGLIGNAEEFCKRVGLNNEQLEGLMDKIMGNMESRAGLIETKFSLISTPNEGTKLTLNYPIKLRALS